MKHRWSSTEAFGKVSAGVLGGALLYAGFVLFASGVVGRWLGATSAAMAFIVWLGFPVWATGSIYAFVAPTWQRAWLLVGGLGAALLAAGIAASSIG